MFVIWIQKANMVLEARAVSSATPICMSRGAP